MDKNDNQQSGQHQRQPYNEFSNQIRDEAGLLAVSRSYPLMRGVDWILDAFHFFKYDWKVWALMTMLGLSLLMIITLVFGVFMGRIVSTIFNPVLLAGLFLAVKAREAGQAIEVQHLFAGFQHPRFGALLGLGSLNLLVAMVLVVILLVPFIILAGADTDPQQFIKELTANGISPKLIAMGLLGLGLNTMIIMAFLFTPALIAFHQVEILEAISLSFGACLKNLGPLFIYALMILVLGVLATLPYMLGWPIFGPILVLSLYRAYLDIFIIQDKDSSKDTAIS